MQSSTLREDAGKAKLVLYGAVTDSKPTADGLGGTAKFAIERVIKSDPFLGKTKEIELPRLVPVTNPKNPPRFVIFCDVFNNKLDPYRGTPANSPAVVDYLQGALKLDGKDRTADLQFFFKYLDHKDADVAQDAFLELARATDQELGKAAPTFDAAKLRAWVQDPQLSVERLNLYAFLLGACGGERDAALLRAILVKPDDKTMGAYQGVLTGYIQVNPRDGWQLAQDVLKDPKKPFMQRYAVLRALRFYHGWKPTETRREVIGGLALALDQGDVADLAVEDLRRYEIWDLTANVLAQFDKKTHSAPIVKRSILRYALCCPGDEARNFVARVRKQDAEMVRDVEESLQFEKRK
jgi:hypothetical protein